ncbi:4'-phosphopantetheinyl transferase family protein [Teredinibacter sp. KSP-S5-2]|uniref:4'-phosphopantetheinyl transferase family protein n=1 Tax=Teredinibacter sp. KSP-S5-2 TaxID=3034506 RepID=UPI0029350FAE|nr:4'-phosphopantetheinyl transferase superfamily protein [Teredinibacter sp. KSP-S5-2]WNO09224.1 4'-phosphopantetheinyl transferase superfamily protein [Teredinibacter sp. KSP-S5-2]
MEIDFYLKKIPDSSQFDFGLAEQYLDEQEKSRAEKFKSTPAKIRFMYARQILKQALHQRTGSPIADLGLRYSENGKPFLKADINTYFSISHCDTHVAVAIGEHNLGIDIEPLQRRGQPWKRAEGFLNPEVGRYVSGVDDEEQQKNRFARLWCATEALVKYKDSSIFTEKNNLNVLYHLTEERELGEDTNRIEIQTAIIDAEGLAAAFCSVLGFKIRYC